MTSLWYFNEVNLFKTLCPHKFKSFKKEHTFNAYNKKDYIYFEEDTASKIYLIEKGKVKIGYYTNEGEEIVKDILTHGDIFGEKAILGENKRNEFAQALDHETSICPIQVEAMHNLMRDNQTFSLKVYKFLGFKLQKLERRLRLLLFKDTRTRFLEFLDELSEEYGEDIKTGDKVIKNPYTQKDIASLIGTSRSTLNVILNELKAEKFLEFSRTEIKIFKKTNKC